MKKINLVKNGIFPLANTGEISTGFEFAGTIQGEGFLIGTPSLFIRTSGCNLRCQFTDSTGKSSICDTPYSSFEPETNLQEVDEVLKTIIEACGANIKHIVLTGGEPLLQLVSPNQPTGLVILCKQLRDLGFHITLETNGTLKAESLNFLIDFISVSPKLSSSAGLKSWKVRHNSIRYNSEVFKYYAATFPKEQQQWKFVLSAIGDFEEIQRDFVDTGIIDPSRIVIMPEGTTAESQLNCHWMIGECIKRGWRFIPRIHVLYWGSNRYV